jgi:endonuclease/exonuclease/phosphatase family metal-dependent hydrolase
VDPCAGATPTPTPTPTPPQGNQAPQLSVSASPTSGSSPLFVSFSSTASDVDGYIASYSWNFADGTTSNLPNPTHTFQSPGVYVVYLQVMDNSGTTATKGIQINVASPATTTQLRVLSWNINFGNGTDGINNFDRTTTSIAKINPDLVALCEVPVDSVSTIVNLLNQKTGRSWSSHYVAKWAGYTEGNLILSKWGFVSTDGRYLSYSRSVAEATVNVGGRTISFFATHLDPDSSSVRYQQVGELMSWASNFSESRIVLGDFNAGPDTSESIRMTGAYCDSWMQAMGAGTAVAYPDNPVWAQTRTRRGRIDYVFYSQYSGNLFLKGTQIPDMRDLSNTNVVYLLGTLDDKGVRPSDHNPTIATFDLR